MAISARACGTEAALGKCSEMMFRATLFLLFLLFLLGITFGSQPADAAALVVNSLGIRSVDHLVAIEIDQNLIALRGKFKSVPSGTNGSDVHALDGSKVGAGVAVIGPGLKLDKLERMRTTR